jgi:thioredoxin-related protein
MSRAISFIKILIFIPYISILAMDIDFDIDKSIVDANKTAKHIMLFFHKDNCGYCERMSFNLDRKEVLEAIDKDFVLLDINRDDDEIVVYQDFNGTNREFLKALDIDFYPTILFIDSSKNEIIYALLGYRDSEKLLNVLKYISSKSYKRVDFEEFKDELFFD